MKLSDSEPRHIIKRKKTYQSYHQSHSLKYLMYMFQSSVICIINTRNVNNITSDYYYIESTRYSRREFNICKQSQYKQRFNCTTLQLAYTIPFS